MKKILITVLSLLALPASATFYNGGNTVSWDGPSAYQKGGQNPAAADGIKDFNDELEKDLWEQARAGKLDTSRFNSSGRSWQGAAPPVEDPQSLWEAYERAQYADKKRRKQARNTAYGRPGSKTKGGSSGSGGSKKDWQGGSRGSKGMGSKGSRGGSKGDKWLDKEEKRDRQLEIFKKILMQKFDKLPDWNGDKDSDWKKEFDKDFWSDKEFEKALWCWLSPHLHEDSEWVNRHWKKLRHKIWWWLKHHKHKFPDKPKDPPKVVPLPASVYLFGTALLGLGAIGRRRSKADAH